MTVVTKIAVTTKPSTPPPPEDDKRFFLGEHSGGNEEEGDIVVVRKKRMIPLACALTLFTLLLASASILALLVFDSYSKTQYPRYTGYCNIPIDILRQEHLQPVPREQLIEPNYREHRPGSALRWSSNPDVQIFSTDEGKADNFVNSLREEFDVGGRIEKIRVFDNGKTISFIHDFGENVTGIVDDDRCFVMDLDPSLVLAPDLLVFAIENGGDFDLSRVHRTMRAVIPALMDMQNKAHNLSERCRSKPTYQLQSTTIKRKRSSEPAPHQYIHFAGKHIQEIEIANLNELIEHEKKN